MWGGIAVKVKLFPRIPPQNLHFRILDADDLAQGAGGADGGLRVGFLDGLLGLLLRGLLLGFFLHDVSFHWG